MSARSIYHRRVDRWLDAKADAARTQALKQPYFGDISADEIERRYQQAIRAVRQARPFAIEDGPTRKVSSSPFRVALRGGKASWR
jgi:hypothetical protein